MLLSGHKYNKMNHSVEGCKGSAVHSPGQGSSSQTSVLKYNHWHKAFGRVFLLMLWAGFHFLREKGPFHYEVGNKAYIPLFYGNISTCQYK